MSLELDARDGWPRELRVLLTLYPREVWHEHRNLGEMARFWLDRHDGFRRLGGALEKANADFREGGLAPDCFRRTFAPRLQLFLQSLEGHHHIEDHHFFPVFRAAETRLQRGFDVLEQDHATIHQAILTAVETANALLSALDGSGDSDALRRASDRYADASDRLITKLHRHLGDEEDLIVPVILDQGERTLFWG